MASSLRFGIAIDAPAMQVIRFTHSSLPKKHSTAMAPRLAAVAVTPLATSTPNAPSGESDKVHKFALARKARAT
jgi:hypothetical protein